jgi:hypothetical protein
VETNQLKKNARTYIYNAQEEVEMKFSCIPPPILEPGKAWHGLNRNQGVVGEHDEQYQMPAGT